MANAPGPFPDRQRAGGGRPEVGPARFQRLKGRIRAQKRGGGGAQEVMRGKVMEERIRLATRAGKSGHATLPWRAGRGKPARGANWGFPHPASMQ